MCFTTYNLRSSKPRQNVGSMVYKGPARIGEEILWKLVCLNQKTREVKDFLYNIWYKHHKTYVSERNLHINKELNNLYKNNLWTKNVCDLSALLFQGQKHFEYQINLVWLYFI